MRASVGFSRLIDEDYEEEMFVEKNERRGKESPSGEIRTKGRYQPNVRDE